MEATKNLTDRDLDTIYNEARLAGDVDLVNWARDALMYGDSEIGQANRVAIIDRLRG